MDRQVNHDHSPDNLRRLAIKHIGRYHALIQASVAGRPNVRRGECKELLEIWSQVRAHADDYEALSAAAKGEIFDAIEAGE